MDPTDPISLLLGTKTARIHLLSMCDIFNQPFNKIKR